MDVSLRHYIVPLFFALLLHALAVAALRVGWEPKRDMVREIKPQIVHSTLLVLEPKAKPTPRPKPKPVQAKPAPAPKPVEKPAPDVKPKPVVSEPKPGEDPEIQRREREKNERDERLRQLENSAFIDAIDSESSELADDKTADAEAAAQSYRYGIYQKVVANWSRPPSARNGMQAKLLVELVPTGDVVAVTLVEGSGSGVFDQSAESAVRKARRFEVPKDSALFEEHFRRFTLLFRPEDLLR